MTLPKARIPIFISIFIIICLVVAGLYLIQIYQKECARSLVLENELTDIKARYSEMEKKLEKTEKQISDLQTKLQDTESRIEELNTSLTQEKEAHQETLSRLEQLKNDSEEQKKLRADLENKLEHAQIGARKNHEELIKLDLEKKGLEKRIEELETKTKDIELGTIVVTPEGAPVNSPQQVEAVKGIKTARPIKAGMSREELGPIRAKIVDSKPVSFPKVNAFTPSSEGKILTVNKDYDFAVIDLGSQNGVMVGQIFSVYGKSGYIGDIRIEKAHNSLSAAGFITSGIKDKISEGNKVTQKK